MFVNTQKYNYSAENAGICVLKVPGTLAWPTIVLYVMIFGSRSVVDGPYLRPCGLRLI